MTRVSFRVTVIGGGMITHDQILPSLYQLQRLGAISSIAVCSQRASTLERLASSDILQRAFPGQSFEPFPASGSEPQPHLYRDVIRRMPPHQLVFIALPDQLHFEAVMHALDCHQHVICVKPLVLTVQHSRQIESFARQRGLFIGVEYHKRLDDRSLLARRRYRDGWFGEFKLGTATLMEKWYYRNSNFQNWCTTDHSDAFTYIGCHYVDLVHFITGLCPTSVSVYGIVDTYPNGNQGFLWTDARILWNNGACLNVQNSLCFPDAAPGTNTQGMRLCCSDGRRGALIEHSDQYRGLKYCYVKSSGEPGATLYAEPSPDYMQYVDLGGPGLVPVGYGFRSIDLLVRTAQRVAAIDSLADRQTLLAEIDAQGLVATPANSRHNEQVIEAGRQSILHGGVPVAVPAA
jgi:predicted dehydrogenase